MIKELVSKILDSKNLDELKEAGKILFEMEDGIQKRIVASVYREKKNAIINELKNNDSMFSDLYWLIHDPQKSFSRIGKLLYRLKSCDIISKSELSILFDLYEKKKKRLEKEVEKGEVELETELETELEVEVEKI